MKKILLSIIILFGLLSINVPITNAAFGASPPWVKNDHLLPGTTFEQVVKLSRNDVTSDMKASIRFLGEDEVNKWITIENKDKLVIKKGEKVLPMKVIVKVPEDATMKDYKGGIFVTLETIKDEKSGKGGHVAIKLGAHIAVDLNVVGKKITDYKVKSITLDPIKGEEPFHLNIEIENKGNTEIKEVNGKVDILDQKTKKSFKSLTFKKLKTPVLSNSIAKTRVDFNSIKLDTGQYWVDVDITKDDKSIYTNRLMQIVGYSLESGINYNLYAASVANVNNGSIGDKPKCSISSETTLCGSTSKLPLVEILFYLLFLITLGLGGLVGVLVFKARGKGSVVEEFYKQSNN